MCRIRYVCKKEQLPTVRTRQRYKKTPPNTPLTHLKRQERARQVGPRSSQKVEGHDTLPPRRRRAAPSSVPPPDRTPDRHQAVPLALPRQRPRAAGNQVKGPPGGSRRRPRWGERARWLPAALPAAAAVVAGRRGGRSRHRCRCPRARAAGVSVTARLGRGADEASAVLRAPDGQRALVAHGERPAVGGEAERQHLFSGGGCWPPFGVVFVAAAVVIRDDGSRISGGGTQSEYPRVHEQKVPLVSRCSPEASSFAANVVQSMAMTSDKRGSDTPT